VSLNIPILPGTQRATRSTRSSGCRCKRVCVVELLSTRPFGHAVLAAKKEFVPDGKAFFEQKRTKEAFHLRFARGAKPSGTRRSYCMPRLGGSTSTTADGGPQFPENWPKQRPAVRTVA